MTVAHAEHWIIASWAGLFHPHFWACWAQDAGIRCRYWIPELLGAHLTPVHLVYVDQVKAVSHAVINIRLWWIPA